MIPRGRGLYWPSRVRGAVNTWLVTWYWSAIPFLNSKPSKQLVLDVANSNSQLRAWTSTSNIFVLG
jgi:hypothetical protein